MKGKIFLSEKSEMMKLHELGKLLILLSSTQVFDFRTGHWLNQIFSVKLFLKGIFRALEVEHVISAKRN